MHSFTADDVGSPDAELLAYGEGSISFSWSDLMYGREGLRIELDGHCSRDMPIRSGYGLKDYVLRRDGITLRFSAELRKKLGLREEIEIRFAISDYEFDQLKTAMESMSY